MTFETLKRRMIAPAVITMLAIILPPLSVLSQSLGEQKADSKLFVSGDAAQAISAFEKRARDYSELCERIERAMPKLAKGSTPEQIQAHKTTLAEKVKTARAGAKRGDILTTEVSVHIRQTIKSEFSEIERRELRKTVREADTKGVPLLVNHTYPDSKELVEMPPTLLLKLPQLPKQLRYRFVDRNMLLVDRENGLIVDYMVDALP